MEEQGFKNEFDEYDEMVPHAVLFMEGRAVATGRLLPGERSGILLLGGWLFCRSSVAEI